MTILPLLLLLVLIVSGALLSVHDVVAAHSVSVSPIVSPPQLVTLWDMSPVCPTPMAQNDTARNATSACWWLEWLPIYAASLQPILRGTPCMEGNWSAAVYEQTRALQHKLGLDSSQCGSSAMVYPLSAYPNSAVKHRVQDYVQGVVSYAFYVDPLHGSDTNPGTNVSLPLRTLHAALPVSRQRPQPSRATVFLRAGQHHLPRPLVIDDTTNDNGLTLTSYPGEDAVIVGGLPMNTSSWTHTSTANLYSTPIPPTIRCDSSTFNELFVDGVRWSPARWPNGDAFVNTTNDGSWSTGTFSFTDTNASTRYPAATTVTLQDVRDTLAFRSFRMGYNGSAVDFADGLNYWAADSPEGGAGTTRTVPLQLTYQGALAERISRWVNVTDTVVHALQRYGWGSWQFRLTSVDLTASTIELGEGGYQEARGCSGSCAFDGQGYFQWQFAELDTDHEYYVDWRHRQLYVYASDPSLLPTTVVPSQVSNMLWVRSVANVTVQGVTIMHSASSHLSLHAAPGGGDWATAVDAAIRITDASNCSLVNNLLTQLGGNAIAVDGSSTSTRIAFNEISYIGANAISVRGTMLGWNASIERTQPADTLIQSNLIHDVGKYNKQSGFVMNAVSYRTVIDGNVMFTSPRSGINVQDGFGGGTTVSHNLIVNTMTETVEGGPLNVWNRLPYFCPNQSSTADPRPYTWEANTNYVHHNLIVVDNAGDEYHQAFNYDDGTTAFDSFNNVVLRSRAGETNHGTANTYTSNLIFPPAGISCWWVSTPTPLTQQHNNTCISLQPADQYGVDFFGNPCSTYTLNTDYETSSNNTYYLPYTHDDAEAAAAQFFRCGDTSLTLQDVQTIGAKNVSLIEHSEQGSIVSTGPLQYPYWRQLGPQLLDFPTDVCPFPPPAAAHQHRQRDGQEKRRPRVTQPN